MNSLRLFLRLSRPLFLAGVAILYALGAGIAHYLGAHIDWAVYVLGQLWVSLLQVSTHYLNEYYDSVADADNPEHSSLTGGSGAVGPGKLSRRIVLMAAFTSLALLAALTVVMISGGWLAPAAYLIMGLAFLGAFFYSVPPVKLEASGLGELVTSILGSVLVPAYAYLLQAGDLHRLVAMSAFPLFTLNLAMLLALELPDYATDIKYRKRNLLVRIGWQNGMFLHNTLILSTFLLLLVAASLGYPRFATLAGLLLLPVGAFQIWQMRNIANGVRPNWNALTIGSVALYAGMAYLLAFAFWTN